MTQDSPDVTVTHNEAARRYEGRIDGDVVGFAAYRESGDDVSFNHTEVSPRWEGRGVGGQIVKAALDDVVASGRRFVPACAFVAHYVAEHPSYREHVA